MNLGLGLFLGSRGPVVAIFDPATVANMLLRYRAADAVLNAGNVDTVPNSGTLGAGGANVNNLAFATARPPLITADAAFNNQPSVNHNLNSRLQTGTLSTPVSQPSTWYFCGLVLASADTINARVRYSNTGGVANSASFSYQPSSTNCQIAAGSAFTPTSALITAKHVSCVVYNGVSSALYVNDMTTPVGTGNPGADSAQTFSTGYFGAPGSPGLKWTEHIGYSGAHDATTRAAIKSYFTAVYG